MGLDWCLRSKPKPGMEKEYSDVCRQFDEIEAMCSGEEISDEEFERRNAELREIKKNVSISPEETLGVPRIGIDAVATEYFLQVILPSYRESVEREKKLEPTTRKQSFIDYWSRPDEELLKESFGAYTPELVKYEHTGIQAYGPFKALAGSFSFRGKAIGYSPLLSEESQSAAYEDMEPNGMLEYADCIEREATEEFIFQMGELGIEAKQFADKDLAVWAESVNAQVDEATDKALLEAQSREKDEKDMSPEAKREFFPSLLYEPSKEETLWLHLRIVIRAAAWLRFWAGHGHAMHAWY